MSVPLNLTQWTEQFFKASLAPKPGLVKLSTVVEKRTDVDGAVWQRLCPPEQLGGRCERCGNIDSRRYRSMKDDTLLCAKCYLED